MAKKFIDIMDTTFRDGFQSVFGGRVLMDDFFPAVEAAKEAGITHYEFGGGARFQSLYFYLQEDAFLNVKIPLPSLEEQNRLLRNIDKYSNLLKSLKVQHKNLIENFNKIIFFSIPAENPPNPELATTR